MALVLTTIGVVLRDLVCPCCPSLSCAAADLTMGCHLARHMRRTFALARPFCASAPRAFPRHPSARAPTQYDVEIPLPLKDAAAAEGITPEDFSEVQPGIRAQWSADDLVENENDASSAGHLYLMQQRQNLHYLRLIEHEMPKLVGEFSLTG